MGYADLSIGRLFLSTKVGEKGGEECRQRLQLRKTKSLRAQFRLPHVNIKMLFWHSDACVALRYFIWILAATSEDTGLLHVLFLYLSAPYRCYWYTGESQKTSAVLCGEVNSALKMSNMKQVSSRTTTRMNGKKKGRNRFLIHVIPCMTFGQRSNSHHISVTQTHNSTLPVFKISKHK